MILFLLANGHPIPLALDVHVPDVPCQVAIGRLGVCGSLLQKSVASALQNLRKQWEILELLGWIETAWTAELNLMPTRQAPQDHHPWPDWQRWQSHASPEPFGRSLKD